MTHKLVFAGFRVAHSLRGSTGSEVGTLHVSNIVNEIQYSDRIMLVSVCPRQRANTSLLGIERWESDLCKSKR